MSYVESTSQPQLRRSLGWPSVAAYGLGAILGAGIYSVIGAAAAIVGDGMWLELDANVLGYGAILIVVALGSYALVRLLRMSRGLP